MKNFTNGKKRRWKEKKAKDTKRMKEKGKKEMEK